MQRISDHDKQGITQSHFLYENEVAKETIQLDLDSCFKSEYHEQDDELLKDNQ